METQTFDYIVVGAGSAGSVLANRLSANPKHRVLVLEAGRESHPWSRIPVGFAKLIENPAANWLYSSEPDEGTGQRRIPIPRGKLLGGSSSINGMVFVRGQSQDYDTWAQLGNRGWSYREVLPIFRDMESYQGDADDEYRGRDGPLKVTESNESGADLRRADQGGRRGRHRLHQGLQRREAGRHRHDPGDDPQRSPDEHRGLLSRSRAQPAEPDDPGQCADRMPAARRQALRRRALHRRTASSTKRAPPARSSSAPVRSIRRSCWSCPASASRSCCKSLGIEVRHELKGVGENLRDHYSPRMKWTVPASLGMTYNDKVRGLGLVWQALQYALTHKGLLGLPAAPIRAYIRTRAGLDAPDAAISWIPFLVGDEFPAREEFRRHRDHEHPALGEHRQHSCVLEVAEHAAGDPLQLPERPARPRGDAGGDAHHPAHHDRARHARHRHRRDRAGREHPVRRRIARLGQGATPRPPTIRSAPARWARTRWRWSTTSFACTAWRGCASPMPRSCRR